MQKHPADIQVGMILISSSTLKLRTQSMKSMPIALIAGFPADPSRASNCKDDDCSHEALVTRSKTLPTNTTINPYCTELISACKYAPQIRFGFVNETSVTAYKSSRVTRTSEINGDVLDVRGSRSSMSL